MEEIFKHISDVCLVRKGENIRVGSCSLLDSLYVVMLVNYLIALKNFDIRFAQTELACMIDHRWRLKHGSPLP